MRSWKTTSAGILSVAGGVARVCFALKNGQLTEEAVTTSLTGILAGIGLLFARDNNVSSVDLGLQNVEKKADAKEVITPAENK